MDSNENLIRSLIKGKKTPKGMKVSRIKMGQRKNSGNIREAKKRSKYNICISPFHEEQNNLMFKTINQENFAGIRRSEYNY